MNFLQKKRSKWERSRNRLGIEFLSGKSIIERLNKRAIRMPVGIVRNRNGVRWECDGNAMGVRWECERSAMGVRWECDGRRGARGRSVGMLSTATVAATTTGMLTDDGTRRCDHHHSLARSRSRCDHDHWCASNRSRRDNHSRGRSHHHRSGSRGHHNHRTASRMGRDIRCRSQEKSRSQTRNRNQFLREHGKPPAVSFGSEQRFCISCATG